MSYITNPLTNRPIRVGSKTWKQLVSEQLIIAETPLFESNDKQELKVAKKIVSRQNLGPRKIPIISNNKIIKANKKMTGVELTTHTAKSASKVFRKIQNGDIELPENMDDDQLSTYLEKCILAEVVGGHHKIEKPKRFRSPNKAKYKIEPIESEVDTTANCSENDSSESESEQTE